VLLKAAFRGGLRCHGNQSAPLGAKCIGSWSSAMMSSEVCRIAGYLSKGACQLNFDP